MCAITICLIHLSNDLTAEGSAWSLYAPLAILTILLAVLVVNIVLSISNIKDYISEVGSKLVPPIPTSQCNILIMK
jgi:hypothetical protein